MLNKTVKLYKEVADIMFPGSVSKHGLFEDLSFCYMTDINFAFDIKTYGHPCYLDITEGITSRTAIVDCNGLMERMPDYNLAGKVLSADLLKVSSGGLDFSITMSYIGTFNEFIIHKNHSSRWNSVMQLILSRFTSNIDVFLGDDSVIFSGNEDALREFLKNFSNSIADKIPDRLREFGSIAKQIEEQTIKGVDLRNKDDLDVKIQFKNSGLGTIFKNGDDVGAFRLDSEGCVHINCIIDHELPDEILLYLPFLDIEYKGKHLDYALGYCLTSGIYSLCCNSEDDIHIKLSELYGITFPTNMGTINTFRKKLEELKNE